MKKLCLTSAILTWLLTTAGMAHTIGEHYQGGAIFWVDEKGEHGLIAALYDQPGPDNNKFGTKWTISCSKTDPAPITGATRDGIFSGVYNTKRIIEAQGPDKSYAAKLAATYMGGWYGDWYLPSKEELNLMYKQRKIIGGFSPDQGGNNSSQYWSSTVFVPSGTAETDFNKVWTQCFDDKRCPNSVPYEGYSKCTPGLRTRAIRAF